MNLWMVERDLIPSRSQVDLKRVVEMHQVEREKVSPAEDLTKMEETRWFWKGQGIVLRTDAFLPSISGLNVTKRG